MSFTNAPRADGMPRKEETKRIQESFLISILRVIAKV